MPRNDKKSKGKRQNMIDAREENGWSRKDVARMIGVGTSTIEFWESARVTPCKKYWPKIAEVFHLINRLDFDEIDVDEYVDAFLEITPA